MIPSLITAFFTQDFPLVDDIPKESAIKLFTHCSPDVELNITLSTEILPNIMLPDREEIEIAFCSSVSAEISAEVTPNVTKISLGSSSVRCLSLLSMSACNPEAP